MKLSKKILTGLVMAALAVGVSTTALAAEVKEEPFRMAMMSCDDSRS
jgi:hypothetical protein